MTDKRPLSLDSEDSNDKAVVAVKKARTEEDKKLAVSNGVKRTSNLSAPVLQLEGHQAEVFNVKFSPDGQCLASSSFDKSILLWRTYDENENYLVLNGHKNAILDLHWFADGERLLSCSADRTVRAWDLETGAQVKKLSEHTKIVNSCAPARIGAPVFASGGDDGLVKVWDLRSKRSVATFREAFAVCAVAMTDAGDAVFAGGLDNTVRMWELRKGDAASMELEGHSDTITGLRLSPDGSHLLSNAMDNTLRVWDVRPYAPPNRCSKVLAGHLHTFEKNLLRCTWSPDGKRLACGSADKMVHIWDAVSGKELYRLPGHKGSVNEVSFHPSEPIVASASSDKTVFLGELL